jgi:nucleotide-binding universal stress UspA family protein
LRSRFETVLSAKGVPYDAHLVRCDTSTDSIGQLVVNRAAALGAAAIVMAKHNKGVIKEFFVGSTTSYVVAHSRVPVIVLHND